MNKIVMLFVSLFSLGSLAALPRYNIDPYSHYYTAEQTFAGGMTFSGGMTISDLSDVSGDAVCMSGANLMGTCAAAVFTTSVSSPDFVSAATAGADDLEFKPAGTLMLTIAEAGNVTVVNDLVVSGNDITANNLKSAVTGGADDITISPAGTTAATFAETTGNMTLVGDLTITGNDITLLNVNSALTGGADDILIKPAGTTALTVAEGGNATLVGDLTVSGNDITANNMSSAATGGADDMSFKPATVAVLNIAEAGEIQMMKKVTSHAACTAVGDIGRIELYGVANTVNLCVCVQTGVGTFAWAPVPVTGAC